MRVADTALQIVSVGLYISMMLVAVYLIAQLFRYVCADRNTASEDLDGEEENT
jgi:hypothetical protein